MKIDKDTVSLLVASFSILISAFALHQTSNYNKTSIKPLIGFLEDPAETSPQIGVSIENGGLGPAIIRSMDMFVDQVKVANWEQVVKLCGIKNSDEADWHVLENGDPIRVSEAVDLFFRSTKKSGGLDSFVDCIDKHLAISINYDSLDGEHYITCYNKTC